MRGGFFTVTWPLRGVVDLRTLVAVPRPVKPFDFWLASEGMTGRGVSPLGPGKGRGRSGVGARPGVIQHSSALSVNIKVANMARMRCEYGE